MSMNQTPAGDRVHIGFFGRRNAGKSSIVNAVTGQQLAIVSEIKGTTTDPVYKTMELLPMGPVMIIDTPGIDDEGFLGEQRIKKTKQVLNKIDVAVLVVDATEGIKEADEQLLQLFGHKSIPYVIVMNKSDMCDVPGRSDPRQIWVSAKENQGITELKEKIAALIKGRDDQRKIVSDLLKPSDVVVLVVPIDDAAPKGRLILPQQQTIRDILDGHGVCIVARETELEDMLAHMGMKPKLVITDSQAFGEVKDIVPKDIWLTSFSILFARYKGNLKQTIEGVRMLDKLKDGDNILISEGCTHHRQCNDIGTVKIPGMIRGYTGCRLNFDWTSGTEFPENLSKYQLIVHCGGCMLNEREMNFRQESAGDAKVPMTNYGILMAHINGILKRSLEPFPDIRF